MNEILAFTVISLLLVISPGPNSFLILKTATSKGRRASCENILGLVLATFAHGAISILGFSALILQSATLFTVVKFVGAAYLLYLGIKTIIGTLAYSSKPAKFECGESSKGGKFYQHFVEGFLTQLLNPKVSMFYLAAFPQFVDFEGGNYLGAFLLVAIHAFTILLWFLAFTLVVSKMKSIAKGGQLGRWVQRISGGVLVYFSGLLLTQEASK